MFIRLFGITAGIISVCQQSMAYESKGLGVLRKSGAMGSVTGSIVKIARDFSPSAYTPPFYARNNHVNTILGSGELERIIRNIFRRNTQEIELDYKRERISTEDNDFFDVDFVDNLQKSEKGVIVLHGLESNSRSPICQRLAKSFLSNGFNVALVNFRGCSGVLNNTQKQYHLGFTEDVKYLVERLQNDDRFKRIYLSGFSLGGNVVVKFLGELGEDAISYGICGGAVVCVPYNCEKSQKKLETGLSYQIYSKRLLASLMKKGLAIADSFPAGPVKTGDVLSCKTIRDFDEAIVAKIYGFNGATDYYRKNQAEGYINLVRVPLFGLHALDDPFIDEKYLPDEMVAQNMGAPVKLSYHQHGGHCSFLSSSNRPYGRNGYMPTEFSRFFSHIENALESVKGANQSN